jgi:SAM-dependent methyltransferase
MDELLSRLRCPRTGSPLTRRSSDGALVSDSGGHVYPLVAGIYDFRLFDPPYMTRAEENRLAERLDAASSRMEHADLIDHLELELSPCADEAARNKAREGIGHRRALLERAPARLRFLLNESGCSIVPGSTVLDLGCGSGEALAALIDHGAGQPVGVDISLIELVLAKSLLRRQGKDALLLAACAEALPFVAETFDFIYSPDVIEHVSSQPDYLKEANRTLRNGGQLLFNSPNRYSVVCPEPHVGIWFLTFLPRFLIDPVCRLMGRGPYVGKRLVSLPELRRLIGSSFGEARISSRKSNPQARSAAGRMFAALSPFSERAFAYVADQHVVLARK